MVGTAISMRGIFRPNWQMINPKEKFPNKPPKLEIDASQLASSIDIGPVGKGDSFDVNRWIEGDDHPVDIPYPNVNKFTEWIKIFVLAKIATCLFLSIVSDLCRYLPTNAAAYWLFAFCLSIFFSFQFSSQIYTIDFIPIHITRRVFFKRFQMLLIEEYFECNNMLKLFWLSFDRAKFIWLWIIQSVSLYW